MPITNLLTANLPSLGEDLQLTHVNQDIQRRHVAALAAWKAESYKTHWSEFATKYDAILHLGHKAPAADVNERKRQKSSMMRAMCQDVRKVAERFNYEKGALVDRLIHLFGYDLDEDLGRLPHQSTTSTVLPPLPTLSPPSSSSSAATSSLLSAVSSSQSYWFKRLDERLVCLAQDSRKLGRELLAAQTRTADASTLLAGSAMRIEALLVRTSEDSRRGTSVHGDGDGGSQVESSDGARSDDESDGSDDGSGLDEF
ncbi:hypothetical protein Pmar_PMAR019151 [Perkinsus marinus ATCC 50983]|uniref:Uncharacterized protein n=1 Tax=Perkinsus marinus (strain ATCC 50983 / TXsc) TaxID=423536 RepID=C5KU03_PERM5|nr:hypothetical protein Pmar_PMAR019151 [Perkinsus marinus ATCC 50983]EER12045.1 hypothetical protein Pmar_PMAR019151 [Perkinsus marinus ATCC 50983]|eukprot:XP_002780250.1 hypothetical protein Pmar_PMAR019151 [Perkinsus marinus ATCC 50983]